MPPAFLCWTVVYTVLLSLAETALLGENGGRALRAESTSGWPKLNLAVTLKGKHAGVSYTMVAEPVVSEGGSNVRYNAYARFDESSKTRFDKSIISYRQTDGYVTVVDTSNTVDPTVCLDSESGPYPIPSINAIAQNLLYIKAATDGVSVPGCPARFRITPFEDALEVCKGSDGASFTVSGDDWDLTVTYNPGNEVIGNGGSASKCNAVAGTILVSDTYGKTFLKP